MREKHMKNRKIIVSVLLVLLLTLSIGASVSAACNHNFVPLDGATSTVITEIPGYGYSVTVTVFVKCTICGYTKGVATTIYTPYSPQP
jgi:hypothetical protein